MDTMQFLEILVSQVKEYINEHFFTSDSSVKFECLPSDLYRLAINSKLKTSLDVIPGWGDFERGIIEFDEHVMKDLLFAHEPVSSDSSIDFISDETMKTQKGFSFILKDYESFVTYYEARFHSEFFQPLDYVVIIKDLKKMKLIHHEGKLITIG